MTDDELKQRVVFALFAPAVRLALRFELPLVGVKRAMETAYFHEARKQGLGLREICEVLGISISKAALLSKHLKEGFLDHHATLPLARRIEYLLWARPLTLPRLNQIMPQERFVEIEQALDALIAQGRVERLKRGPDARYRLVLDPQASAWDATVSQLDELYAALGVAWHGILARFFEPQAQVEGLPAFQRVRVRPQDYERLRALLTELQEASSRYPDDAQLVEVAVFGAEPSLVPELPDDED